jgi:hypothetical protein
MAIKKSAFFATIVAQVHASYIAFSGSDPIDAPLVFDKA